MDEFLAHRRPVFARRGVSALPATEHFRIMAYAQLTWRESLRDIEATLGANIGKLFRLVNPFSKHDFEP